MSAEAAPEPRADHLIGALLANRYLIEAKLGEGAMGAVYRARHVKVGRPFAVKVLHRRLLSEEKIALRFEREAELAGRLRHPNVIGVVDVGETADDLRYMVMDYAEGSDLADLLSEAPMPAARIIHLVRQMLEGLYHAHEAGLIHRDFKPENVIVERDDHGTEIPRIVDFGISILREGGDSTDATGRLTTNGLVLGTPHYMAPEQAVADPIDHRIDLFAMGIVVYEMLCGMLPFDGNGAEIARANLLLDPPSIATRVPYLEVDPLLEAFSRHLMAKKRDHRPANAKKARELLDLIDRDRAAAAAVLGVSIDVATRPQAVTMSQPKAHASPDAPTAPLPASGSLPAQPARPSQLEAPPAQYPHAPPAAATAMPAPPGPQPPMVRAQDLATSPAEPLPWSDDDEPPRAKRRLAMIGGAALAAVGVIVAIVLAGSGGDERPDPPAAAVAAADPQQPKPPEPAADPPRPPEPAKIDPEPAKVEPEPAKIEPEPVKAAPTKPHQRGRPGPTAKPDPARITQAPAKPEPARPDPAKIAQAKAMPDPAKPAPAADIDQLNAKLFAEYQQVNAALHALEKARGGDATSDLWPLYRHVSYTVAIQDEGKRRVLVANLAKIREELAKRQR